MNKNCFPLLVVAFVYFLNIDIVAADFIEKKVLFWNLFGLLKIFKKKLLLFFYFKEIIFNAIQSNTQSGADNECV